MVSRHIQHNGDGSVRAHAAQGCLGVNTVTLFRCVKFVSVTLHSVGMNQSW